MRAGGNPGHVDVIQEAELVRASKDGLRSAFAELVRAHQGRVRAYIASHLRGADVIDDLAQDVFLAAYRGLADYRQDAPLAAWLLGIARNKVLVYLRDEVRRRARRDATAEALLLTLGLVRAEEEASPAHRREADLTALQSCLDRLPKTSSTLVSAHYFEGRALAEIARDMGRKESAIRMTLLRIRQALRQCLKQQSAAC